MLIFQFDAGNPLDQPLPLNSDFWEKKSQYYSHGTSSDEDVRLAEEVVAHRLQLKHDDKSRRLEAQLELIAPVVDKAERKWAELVDDVDHLNFTAIEWEIENELPEPNDRTWRKGRERGRGARGLPAFLGNAVKLFDLKQVVKELETSVMTSVSCSACKAGNYNLKRDNNLNPLRHSINISTGVGLLQHYVDSGKSTDEIVHASTKLCMSLKIESRRVCEGIILAMADEVVFVLSRLILTADEICGFVIGDVCAIPYNPYHDWEVALPPIPKPALISQQMPNPGGGVSSPPLKVLHLSDTHFDPYYHEGSTANCNEPLCCRLTDGIPDSPTNGAGRWGDYRKCDTPRHTIESMLQHIANYHQV